MLEKIADFIATQIWLILAIVAASFIMPLVYKYWFWIGKKMGIDPEDQDDG